MITLRRAEDRGHGNYGWLDTWHTFSFDSYYDPRFMGFRALRVINEDRIEPGFGFGTHSHRDMEIITVVLEGALAHRDSTGAEGMLRPGEVQRMSAGTGVRHSEFNDSKWEQLHLLQIWIEPERKGLEPGYEQKTFPEEQRRDRLQLVASPDGREDSLIIHQDTALYLSRLAEEQTAEHALAPGRHAWIHVARGAVTLNGEELKAGDGAAVSEEKRLHLAGTKGGGELLLFDLA